eukprot:3993553-Pleurochrysis_carterae.AAC.1
MAPRRPWLPPPRRVAHVMPPPGWRPRRLLVPLPAPPPLLLSPAPGGSAGPRLRSPRVAPPPPATAAS